MLMLCQKSQAHTALHPYENTLHCTRIKTHPWHNSLVCFTSCNMLHNMVHSLVVLTSNLNPIVHQIIGKSLSMP